MQWKIVAPLARIQIALACGGLFVSSVVWIDELKGPTLPDLGAWTMVLGLLAGYPIAWLIWKVVPSIVELNIWKPLARWEHLRQYLIWSAVLGVVVTVCPVAIFGPASEKWLRAISAAIIVWGGMNTFSSLLVFSTGLRLIERERERERE